MVNGTEELLDLDMEPKLESQWWSTYKGGRHDNNSSGKQRQNLGPSLS